VRTTTRTEGNAFDDDGCDALTPRSNASSSNASSSRDAVGARVCVGVLTFDDARESRREVPVRRDSRERARDGRD
jgi:hypothetical protein